MRLQKVPLVSWKMVLRWQQGINTETYSLLEQTWDDSV